MASGTFTNPGVFADTVFTSTDLNRRGGEVLNQALKHPVTISRNAEQFALMPREQAARLYRSLEGLKAVTSLLEEVQAAIGGQVPTQHFRWLSAFEKDDLQRLSSEVLHQSRQILDGAEDWDQMDGLIHAWRESAMVAESGALDDALFSQAQDEEPLPSPGSDIRGDE
jgi:hypothetical protein